MKIVAGWHARWDGAGTPLVYACHYPPKGWTPLLGNGRADAEPLGYGYSVGFRVCVFVSTEGIYYLQPTEESEQEAWAAAMADAFYHITMLMVDD